MNTHKEKALFFAVSGLGDNLFAYPALWELEKRCALTVVVSNPAQVQLFRALLPESTIVAMPAGKMASCKLAWDYRGVDYWLYSVGSSFRKPRFLNLLGGARHRYAFTSLSSENAWQLELGFDVCLTPDLGQRAWRNNYRLLTLIDPTYLKNMKPWDFYAAEARSRVAAAVRASASRRSLFIHAGCNKYPGGLERYKRWPVNRFLDVAQWMATSGMIASTDFLLGPADDDLRDGFDAWTHGHAGSVATPFDETAHHNDLLRIAQRLLESDIFLGNDSGIAHMAALLAVPTVVIMGAIGQPAYTAPDGVHSLTIQHPVPCQGCTVGISYKMALEFQCPNQWACMDPIQPDDVTAALQPFYARLPFASAVSP